MNLITKCHDFNLPIKFNAVGFEEFCAKNGLVCTESAAEYNGKARFDDPLDNVYAVKITMCADAHAGVFAELIPAESQVLCKLDDFRKLK